MCMMRVRFATLVVLTRHVLGARREQWHAPPDDGPRMIAWLVYCIRKVSSNPHITSPRACACKERPLFVERLTLKHNPASTFYNRRRQKLDLMPNAAVSKIVRLAN